MCSQGGGVVWALHTLWKLHPPQEHPPQEHAPQSAEKYAPQSAEKHAPQFAEVVIYVSRICPSQLPWETEQSKYSIDCQHVNLYGVASSPVTPDYSILRVTLKNQEWLGTRLLVWY